MQILILTEKTSVAVTLAQALLKSPSNQLTHIKGTDPVGNDTIITWAQGHLLGLAEPDSYDPKYKAWNVDDLPIVPPSWHFKQAVNDDPSKQRRIREIKEILSKNKIDEAVNACDAGREGELIFSKVAVHLGFKNNSRMWLQTNTEAGILTAYKARQNSTVPKYSQLSEAARTRDESDWFVGMNYSRLVAKTLPRPKGKDTQFSVGRVQTPTLALIVDRNEIIESFVSNPFYDIEGKFPSGEAKADLTRYSSHPKAAELLGSIPKGADQRPSFWDKAKAEGFVKLAQPLNYSVRDATKQIKESPPAPLNLVGAQKLCNQMFDWTLDRTLTVLQGLYEKGFVSYPRTSSQGFPTDMKTQLYGFLTKIWPKLASLDTLATLGTLPLPALTVFSASKAFDDKKVTDHYALSPTEKIAGLEDLSEDEMRAYILVTRYMVMSTDEPAVLSQTDRSWTSECPNPYSPVLFKASRKKLLILGWKKWDKKDKEITGFEPLTATTEKPIKVSLHEGKTTPPKQYDDSSLVDVMENVSRTIGTDDIEGSAVKTLDEVVEAMSDKGLGTPATRHETLKSLIHKNLVVREKKKLFATDAGKFLIHELRKYAPAVTTALQTVEWEHQLLLMEKGDPKCKSRTLFLDALKDEFVKVKPAFPVKTLVATTVLCPISGKPIMEAEKYFWAPGMTKTFFWKSYFSRSMTPDDFVKVILAHKDGKKVVFDGFVNKDGTKKFSGLLYIDADNKVQFAFPDNVGKKLELLCPKTNKPLEEFEKYFQAPGWPTVKLWKAVAGKNLSSDEWVSILTGWVTGKQHLIKDLTSAKGNKFNVHLVLNVKEGKLEFAFPAPSGAPTSALCPVSKKPIQDCGKFYLAPGYEKIKLWKTVSQREMSADDYAAILNGILTRVPVQFEFTSKAGKPYKTAFKIQDDLLAFDFDAAVTFVETKVLCPKSGKPFMETESFYASPGYNGYRFPKVLAKRKMSLDDYVRLIKGWMTKEPVVFDGFTGGKGPFAAKLKAGKDRLEFDFDDKKKPKKTK